jgi:hypothetical protein
LFRSSNSFLIGVKVQLPDAVIPAKAEAPFNSEAGQSGDLPAIKLLDPSFRWDDEKKSSI